ncbi:MAG: aldo/keto reductase [Pseudomonadota bacterium]|jgi:aryl-alcohol dehydrogenase (NADP+)|nr:aldo/keto reductase [Pseudomonadota bacterium]
MKYRTLPGTELEVSTVCLGTMTWGQQNTEAEAHAQLDLAVERGINFIDTAEMYPVPPRAETQGRTEEYLGRWLAGHDRDALVIATKVAGPGRRDWVRGGRTDLNKANITEACETSLRRLRTDRIDLYQIHWPQRNLPNFGQTVFDPAAERDGPSIAEQVEAMGALVRAGKIRYWGLSNESTWGVCAFHHAAAQLGLPGPVTVQNCYSLVSRSADGDLAEALFRNGMSLLPYGPLAGGKLAGKYMGGARPEGARFTLFPAFGPRYAKPHVDDAIAAYDRLAKSRGLSLVQLAHGYVMSRWFVGSSIIGATSTAQLAEDIDAAGTVLDAETLAGIAEIQRLYPNPAA